MTLVQHNASQFKLPKIFLYPGLLFYFHGSRFFSFFLWLTCTFLSLYWLFGKLILKAVLTLVQRNSSLFNLAKIFLYPGLLFYFHGSRFFSFFLWLTCTFLSLYWLFGKLILKAVLTLVQRNSSLFNLAKIFLFPRFLF